ncbi:MAG: FHA domain-containing protein [Planctomycetota bacterium]
MPYLMARNERREYVVRLELPTTRAVIGRARDSNLRVRDSSVSKIHASIEPATKGGRYLVSDLGSRNGLRHGGVRQREIEVRVGEVFYVGDVECQIFHDDLPSTEEPTTTQLRPVTLIPLDAKAHAESEPRRPLHVLMRRGERRMLGALATTALLAGFAGWYLPAWISPVRTSPVVPLASPVDIDARPPPSPLATTPAAAESTIVSEPQSVRAPTPVVAQSSHVASAGAALALRYGRTSEAVERTRRLWIQLYGRWPTADELLNSSDLDPSTLARAAPLTVEYWRERARSHLRGRPGYAVNGRFELPAALLPQEIPLDASDWWRTLARLDVTGAVVEVSALALVSRIDAPQSMTPDTFLRSIYSVLFGSAPSFAVATQLERLVCADFPWAMQGAHLVDALLYAPQMSYPAPAAGAERAWLDSAILLAGSSDLAVAASGVVDEASREEIARQLARGTFDYRRVLRCLLLQQLAPVAATEAGANRSELSAPLRFEVLCGFSARDLLRRPKEIPWLWKRLEMASLQIFAPAEESAATLYATAFANCAGEETVIVSQPASLPHSLHGDCRVADRIWMANGLLYPELTALCAEIGVPRVPAPTPEIDAWLAKSLGSDREGRGSNRVPSAGNEVFAREALRTGGFRLAGGDSAAALWRPATCATELARVCAVHLPNSPLSVWTRVEESSAPGVSSDWQDFLVALEIATSTLSQRDFELWLWGEASTGGAEVLRICWGPSVARGWVRQESQPLRALHRGLVRRPAGAESLPVILDESEAAPSPTSPTTGGKQ